MIIIKLYGGIGNQLFQWAFGTAMGERRNEHVKFDVSSFEIDELRNFELKHIIPNIEIAASNEVKIALGNKSFVSQLNRKFGTLFLPLHKRKIVYEQSFLHDTAIHTSNSPHYYDGYWQNEKYFRDERQTILNHLKTLSFAPPTWQKKIANTISCSIHVRRGDYVKNKAVNETFGTCTLDYYKKAIQKILDAEPTTTFFIFSDDIDWCKATFDFIVKKEFIDDTSSAFEDFSLMQLCQNSIIANSSFSWWAAWLNNNASKQTVAPEKWFANSPFDYREIVPENWIKL